MITFAVITAVNVCSHLNRVGYNNMKKSTKPTDTLLYRSVIACIFNRISSKLKIRLSVDKSCSFCIIWEWTTTENEKRTESDDSKSTVSNFVDILVSYVVCCYTLDRVSFINLFTDFLVSERRRKCWCIVIDDFMRFYFIQHLSIRRKICQKSNRGLTFSHVQIGE